MGYCADMWDNILHEWLPLLMNKISELSMYGYLFIFLLTVGESLPFVGFFIPVTILMVFMGLVASQTDISLAWLIVWSGIGSSIGYGLGYYLGYTGHQFFKPENRFLKPEYLKYGTAFFKTYGDNSVLVGRFVNPVRPVIAFVAGIFHMKEKRFWIENVVSGYAWATVVLGVGYVFGERVLSVLERSTGYGVYAVLLLVFIVVTFGFKRWVEKRVERHEASLDKSDLSAEHISEQPERPNQQ